ncbi:MAG: IclR family transcriptional regulator, partial [Pseudomonas sp.]
MDPGIPVFAAGFQQQHPGSRVFRQSVGKDATRGAGANDDVVKFFGHTSYLAYSVCHGIPASAFIVCPSTEAFKINGSFSSIYVDELLFIGTYSSVIRGYPMADTNTLTSASSTGSSAERSLRLLARLAKEGRALSLADLAADLALPKGTAHRLCAQLLETGFIARDVNERDFIVGPALRKLSFDTLNHGAVRGLRHQVLSELVAQIGETCNITTLDGASVLYLDRVEAPWPWRLTLAVGEHVPLHCTASGKLFLALVPPKQRDLLISQLSLTAMTEATITSKT